MPQSSGQSGPGKAGGGRKPLSLRVDAGVREALETEAERAGMKLGPYCEGLLEQHLEGDSVVRIRQEMSELADALDRQSGRVDRLGVGLFEALRTILLNLTDISERDLEELQRRVTGR